MNHSVPHSLSADRAKQVLEKAFESYAERFAAYHPTMNWEDDRTAKLSFSVKGKSLTGEMVVRESAIDIAVQVPLLFRVFSKQATDVIEREVRKWVGKAERGEI